MNTIKMADYSTWENQLKDIANEKRIVAMIKGWAVLEEPPCDLTISTDSGYRCFMYLPYDITEEQGHKILAWLIRRSGKKFLRFIRDSGVKPTWWNNDSYDNPTKNDIFTDSMGEFKSLFLLENSPLGKCKVIKKKKEVEVSELICVE